MNRRDANALPDELVEAARNAVDPLSISVRVPDPNTDFGERLIVAARQVEEGTWGAIPVSVEGVPELPDGPVLTIRVGDRAAISYQAVPVGPEAEPFLDALKTLATGGAGTVPELDQPSEIVVFISPDCPNCPHTVRAATQLAAVNRGVTTTVVDISEFADRAAVVGIRSVPMAVVNDGLTLVGAMSAQDLADKIAAQGGPDDEGRVFASLVEAGRFDAAGALLIDGCAREAFLELWRASALEHRIGLVLTAEEVLEADPQALDAWCLRWCPFSQPRTRPAGGIRPTSLDRSATRPRGRAWRAC